MARNRRTSSRSKTDPSRLLLAPGLKAAEVEALVRPYGVQEVKRADENLQAMAGEPRSRRLLAKILGELLDAVAQTADPDQALNHWEHFLRDGVNRVQLFDYLHGSPRMLDLLCAIFGNSPALAQTLIRDPVLVYWLAEERVLSRGPSRIRLSRGLDAILRNVTTGELKLEALRRFRRREMLRIGLRDLLRLGDVRETIAMLSDLASVLIQAAYEIVQAELRAQYGIPRHRDREGRWVDTGFAVIAMGKLGGGELNFSSDVDLIYVYESEEGETHGGARAGGTVPKSIPNEEYFERLGRDLTKALADMTQEGHVFRVDLRLRAEGAVGRLARSLDEYDRYYRSRGQGWERMALLKAWPVAGSLPVGRAFLRRVKPFIFYEPPKSEREVARWGLIEQVKCIKRMIDDKMTDRGQAQRNVKLGVGGIRELEFVVQVVQVLCGGRLPAICHRGTLESLARFARHGVLSPRQQASLTQSYLFLRNVEHKLQMVHDLQTHALPEDEEELSRCAIRLGYGGSKKSSLMRRFVRDYRRHTSRVHRVFRDLVGRPERSRLLRAALRRRKGRPSRKA